MRLIPSVDRLAREEAFESLSSRYSRRLVLEAIRHRLEELRRMVGDRNLDEQALRKRIEGLGDAVETRLRQWTEPTLTRVINATGVIIHTNLGRAPLSPGAARRVAQLASGYSNLELDLDSGGRGSRHEHLETRLIRLLDSEAAIICNNNAAAILLILNTFALGKTVLVSRGELVEIGGSFRIPAIMERSGAILREVGTTNKTRLSDFAAAIDETTGLILTVHPSNYRIVGFTDSPRLPDLVELSQRAKIPLVHDVGSGLLWVSDHPALQGEPAVTDCLSQGVDLVCFSGDKLLGGPQAGIVAGKEQLIDQMRHNPMMRALRIDKMSCAALEQTLIEYELGRAVPVETMLRASPAELRRRTERFRDALADAPLLIEIQEGESVLGGGSAPGRGIPTTVMCISSSTLSPNEMERHLRFYDPPILARIERDLLVIDLRTVLEGEEEEIIQALSSMPARV